MRLLCAWCEKEGKPALIAEVEPREDPTPTHGMCPTHRDQVEALRKDFRPKRIKVLFVGESPPANGTFFYQADSTLYRYTQEAFAAVFGEGVCGEGDAFLRFYQARGCYLEDLCSEPVNKLPLAKRRRAWEAGVAPFAKRLADFQPKVIVVVMVKIQKHVMEAARQAGPAPRCVWVLPFPTQGHQGEYVEQLKWILSKLSDERIL